MVVSISSLKVKLSLSLIILFFVSVASAQVVSNFSLNDEGWTIYNFSTGAVTSPVYSGTGGNPGGNITDGGTATGPIVFYAEAPVKFRGNFSFSYRQNLTFDLKTDFVGTDNTHGDIIIQGTGGALYYQLPTKPTPVNTWVHYVVQMDETFAGWHFNGTGTAAPTQTQMKAVLTNITSLRIRTKYTTGNTATANGYLDNVILNTLTLGTPPVITSFTPITALPGATVTITGNNFNTTAAQNIVYFKGIKAVVNTATANQLTVTVPASATHGQLTVENLGTGLQGTSLQSFGLLFDNNKDFGGRIISSTMDKGFIPLLKSGTETASSHNLDGSMGYGDFDNDGWVDLLLGESSSQRIFAFRNLQTGGTVSPSSFGAPLALSIATIPNGSPNMGKLAVVDVDSDGKLDVAVVSSSGGSIGYLAVFRNTSTTGNISFAAPKFFSYPYYSNQLSMSYGDFDADGRVDFIYTTGTSPGGVWLNQNLSTPGNIDFAYGISVGTSLPHTDVTVGDLNADGKPEIIAPIGTNFEIYKNTSTPGSISFAAPFNVPTSTSANIDVIAVDLDNDSRLDLAWAANGVSVFFSKNNFTTTFDATAFGSTIVVPNKLGDANGIFAGDVNGDSKPDIVMAGTYDMGIMENIGAGSLSSSSFAPTVLYQGSSGGQAITAIYPGLADLDGDNKPEVLMVYRNNNVTVDQKGIYIFHNESYPAPVITSLTPTSAQAGGSVAITGTSLNTGIISSPMVRLTKLGAVISGSPTNTLTTLTTPAGGMTGKISITNHGLTGNKSFVVPFATNRVMTAASFGPSIEFPLAAGTSRDVIEVGDFDDDGKLDAFVIEASSVLKIFRNTATANQPITTSSLTSAAVSITGSFDATAFDIDGDGKIDIHSGTGLFKNTSTSGNISFLTTSPASGGGFTDVATADFNKDGKADLAVANGSANVQVYENQSTRGATFSTSTSFPAFNNSATNLPKPSGQGGVVAEDFDGDGWVDIVAANPSGNSYTVYLNAKVAGPLTASSFILTGTTSTSGGNTPNRVTANDFDGDGKIDIAMSFNTSPFFSVYRNTSSVGDINFSGPIQFSSADKGYGIVSQDLDGDTKPEVVLIHQPNPGPGSFTVFQNKSTSGTVSFGAGINIPLIRNPEAINIMDINSDGKPDIVIVAALGTATPVNAVMVFENKLASNTITINTQPSDVAVCTGSTGSFTTAASGTTNITFQWQFATSSIGPFSDIANGGGYSGVTTSTLSINSTGNFGVGRYRCKISGDFAPIIYTTDKGFTITTCGGPGNQPPVIAPSESAAPIGGIISINLGALISDVDNNLDYTTLTVISQPASGATATIKSDHSLVLDYSGVSFAGTDQLTVQICDTQGSCTQRQLSVDVTGGISVFNAVSPNGDGKNDIFFIQFIDIFSNTKNNKVTIFNRWGDVVFETENYDNINRVFRGQNKSGGDLPSGTYYYVLDFTSGLESRKGFLSLKR